MKHAEYLVLGLAAVAVLLIVKQSKSATPSGGTATAPAGNWVAEIFNGVSAWGNGWRYFDNGTAIDPAGNYYLNGEKVWSPS